MTDAFYDLTVDSNIGEILTCKQKSGNFYKYLFNLYPAKELVLERKVTVEFLVPFDFHEKNDGIKITILDCSKSLDSALLDAGAAVQPSVAGARGLALPWLAGSKYPLGVWLYSVRNLFRNDSLPKWSTPAQLESIIGIDDCLYQPLSSRVGLLVGMGKNKGRRSYMEDVSFQFDFVQTKGDKGVAVYGVLDGHGGGECALYVADELPAKITSYLRTGVDAPEALFNAFLKIDQEFLKIGENVSGSTASVMLWDPYRLRASFANTGDTRSIISRMGRGLNLTMDRKATDHDEISRIARDGGFVSNGRVQGMLAVSRAFGDRRLKELNKGGKRVLIVDPDVSTFQFIPDQDEFVVIATDGLWDVLSSQDVVDFVKSNLLKKGFDVSRKLTASASEITTALNEVADALVKHAIFDLSSGDNVTAMIILLDNCRGVKQTRVPSDATAAKSTVTRGDSGVESSASNGISSSNSAGQTPAASASVPAAGNKKNSATAVDDDLMDFLMDDSNF